ncbi:MAG: zinc ABC transporter substrate-binding protein [Anaerolineaceae bacterium]|nr:zinc ABC transporter substrate-binding protein [Anaerolineaceae bacterium]MBN2678581.1 zinc ABC transporter substrate-binding protein [Anaerolineaceae bacterium]
MANSNKHIIYHHLAVLLFFLPTLSGCQTTLPAEHDPGQYQIVAVESFLADITQNVAGEQVKLTSLVEYGMDPHTFEPTPRDMIILSESDLLIINGAGLETWLEPMLSQESIVIPVLEASAGITPRNPSGTELLDESIDPHFWLDPNLVIHYVENIRDGLIVMDPEGYDTYRSNADGYIGQLKELDAWIRTQVDQVAPENRLLVTNHESFGYFADRYGFKIIGTIIPSVSSGSTPTALQMTNLIEMIQDAKVRAIFLEAGSNSDLAETIAEETGVIIVSGLLTHALTEPEGVGGTYIDMMKFNIQLIVDALK